MADLSPAVKWLEEKFDNFGWSMRSNADYIIRPMFSVHYDHESYIPGRVCWACTGSDELIVIEPEEGEERGSGN